MGSHPANLAVRLALELAALAALGWWGWNLGSGATRIVFAVALPMVAAAVWGIFNVPGDPSRSGQAPIVVPGVVRLILELVVLAAGAWAWSQVAGPLPARLFAAIVAVHYAASYDRIRWLLDR